MVLNRKVIAAIVISVIIQNLYTAQECTGTVAAVCSLPKKNKMHAVFSSQEDIPWEVNHGVVGWLTDRMIASGSCDGIIRLFDFEKKKRQYADMKSGAIAGMVCLYQKNKILFGGSKSGDLKIWDTSKKLQSFSGHDRAIISLAYSAKSDVAASGSLDGDIKIWDVKAGLAVRDIKCSGLVYGSAFAPDRDTLAFGQKDGVVVQDLRSASFRKVHGRGGLVLNIAWAPDGVTMAIGSLDNGIGVWDLRMNQWFFLEGHTWHAPAVDFSPDGDTIASGSLDKTMNLWSCKGRMRTAVLEGCQGRVESVAFSRNGQFIASGSNDSVVRVWE